MIEARSINPFAQLRQSFGRPEHLVSVADDSRPAQLSQGVYHLGRPGPDGGHVSRLHHMIRRNHLEVGDDGPECLEIAVDI